MVEEKGLEEEKEDGFVPVPRVNILAVQIGAIEPSGLDHRADFLQHELFDD